jgi:CRISPR-associated protein Cmr1
MSVLEERVVGLRFITPAFLGDAFFASELRSPPFKAMLRSWWRVAHTGGRAPGIEAMRDEEGRIFGHAWLEHTAEEGKARKWAMKSPVRISLLEWRSGDRVPWPEDPPVRHPEVGDAGRNVGAHLYLGYGPLGYDGAAKRTKLNRPSCVKPGTMVTMRIRYPGDLRESLRLDDILLLWDAFGTVGSRQRNGWGSFAVSDAHDQSSPTLRDGQSLARFTREFEDCLSEDWSHAIGRDRRGPLIWLSRQPFANWSEAMRELARVKIAYRTSLSIVANNDFSCPVIDERHFLAYPVTNHGVLEWSGRDERGRPRLTSRGQLQQTARLANQLFSKVIPESGSRFRALVAHLPHGLPHALRTGLGRESLELIERREKAVWRKVHDVLDKEMERWSG